MPAITPESLSVNVERARLAIRGIVQGVGFRPFVFRLAEETGLAGWVLNNASGILVEIEGTREAIQQFILRIEVEKPPRSSIQSLEVRHLDPAGYTGFEIRESDPVGNVLALIPSDIAMCPDCLRDISTPANRRWRYPFTNCTQCGPRYTIIDSLPYDRSATSMAVFTMCPACRAEYENPHDRRFHAQPNACPECGPHLELWDASARGCASGDKALRDAVHLLAEGRIVAVKGIGGFHLMALAGSEAAVRALRHRKYREEKPFAIMVPSLESAEACCEISLAERRALLSPEAPIVLLRRKEGVAGICEAVAPGNPYWGVMLPYSPLHHLLLAELGQVVVATSGNLSNEPICFDESEVIQRLGSIADAYLVHNRPIRRAVDDSIVQVVLEREMVLRRARGFVPISIELAKQGPRVFAAGAQQKSAIALSDGKNVFLSQHLGDLESEPAYAAYQTTSRDLPALIGFNRKDRVAEVAACDLHPGYQSTTFARSTGLPLVSVQHHYAHALACMADNELEAPCLAVCWDGTGQGTDGTIWGGEFLRITETGFDRVAWLRPFRLPGGEAAAREPRRSALGMLFEIFGEPAFEMKLPSVEAFESDQKLPLKTMLKKGIQSPVTSSAGRLFDAMSSLLGLYQRCQFEGQAAMALEFKAMETNDSGHYPYDLRAVSQETVVVDWEPAVRSIIAEIENSVSPAVIASRFHNTLVQIITAVARQVSLSKVILTGGCFQNRRLLTQSVECLRKGGFNPYWHQRIPPNDGGIALGQAVAAARQATFNNNSIASRSASSIV